jgi:hypothetical protein
MSTYLTKAASILAFVIGAMAIFSGGKVILGYVPDYYVIDWVPIYNFSAGLITSALTAILIWRKHRYALSATIATLISHSTVMVILQTTYREVVAPDSIQAMTLRISVWLIILGLMVIQVRKDRPADQKKKALQQAIHSSSSN